MNKKLIALFIILYIVTIFLVLRTGFIIGRDSVAEEARRYVYKTIVQLTPECKR